MDDQQIQQLRDSVARLLAKRGMARVRGLRGTIPGFERAMWDEMAAQGWCGLRVPEEFGGLGLDSHAAAALAEELARGLAPEPFTATALQAVDLLISCPDGPARNAHLTEMATGELIAGVGGGDALVAKSGERGIVLSGDAMRISPGRGADRYFLLASGGSVTMVLSVAPDAPGLTVAPQLCADGTWSARIEAREVVLDEASVLARGDDATFAFGRARLVATLMTAAELCGCMDRALEITLDYMKTREQFDRPIGAFQALQHRAVDLHIQRELARSVLAEAITRIDSGKDPDRAAMEAARAKARATHAALLIGREAIKLHGAIGVTDDYDVGLYLRRILVLAARHGNAAAQRAEYARIMQRNVGWLVDDEDASACPPAEFMAEGKLGVDWNRFCDAAFRAGVRAYFRAHYPTHLRNLGRRGTPAEMADWMARMVRKGWMAPAWPVEHGGMGLSPAKQIIFIEERERAGIARNPDQGVVMFGPMLMRHGTEEQKARYLPGILRNEIIFCQGYSEPNAGSDLASLRSEARPAGDGFILNGSKIWTTMAHHATHMFLLARTDKTVRKQAGISFFILDLATEGVTIRPIQNLAGDAEFCEVFFDDVHIPAENLVGAVNNGWSIAKSVLGYERLNNGSPRRVQGPLRSALALAAARGLADDPVHLAACTAIYLDIADLKSAYGRFCDIVAQGVQPGPEISMLKIWAGECAQRLSEYLIELAGEDGGIREKLKISGSEFDILSPFYAMFPAQIASGSSDVQRNILATRVLGLPREPKG